VLALLYPLLQKDQAWSWQAAQAEAFQKSKDMLTSSSMLTHYNPDFELTLACDASQYGLGAVLSHHFPSGEEKPIAFASCTLSKAEQNYSQIEKESLALFSIWSSKICMVGSLLYIQTTSLWRVYLIHRNQYQQ